MRKVLRSSMFAVGFMAVVVGACGRNGETANRAMSDDLKRDLQLASSSGLNLASQQAAKSFPLTEIPISSSPAPAKTLRKSNGPKAIKSKRPTVKATPEPTRVANAEVPETPVPQKAPSPTTESAPDPSPPAVPRPSPVPADPGTGGVGHGRDGGGQNPGSDNGIGAVVGTIFGVILRGGVVDGDHCDPRSDGRGRRRGPSSINNQWPFPPGSIIP